MSDVCVLIPTHRRAKFLEPLLKNMIETTKVPFVVYFICDHEDEKTISEVDRLSELHPASVIKITTAVKGASGCVNYGYLHSREELVFTATDDLVFPTNWLEMAIEQLGDKPALAIADTHAFTWCLFLLRRSYIEKYSCCEDHPNTISIQDYNSNADSELVLTLDNRGDINFADFTIEHVSPVFYGHTENGKLACPEYLIRDLRIPFSNVHTEIVPDPRSGKMNILRVVIVPKNPLPIEEWHANNMDKEGQKRDEQIILNRCHLWGGNTCMDRIPIKREEALT